MTNPYIWTDNAMEVGVADANPDIVNECLMHLKYDVNECLMHLKCNNSSNNLLDFKWSDHLLNDESWLRSDTFSWHSGEVYQNAYDHLLDDIQDKELIEEIYSLENWSQPTNMTSNGVLGGSTFAVWQRETGRGDFYNCINGNAGLDNFWYNKTNSGEFIFYNPDPIIIKKITWIVYDHNRNPLDYTIQGSNDGIGYVDIIKNQTAASGETTVMNLSSNDNAYRYYKLIVHAFNTGEGNCKGFIIEAQKAKTIQYYLADDGHKICPVSEESKLIEIYNTTGIAWFYLIDTENQRFKLPRTEWGFVGYRSGVGNFVPESLPNINASFASVDPDASGAISLSGQRGAVGGGTNVKTYTKIFNASLSSPVYQDNAPVQQRATEMYLYFYVGLKHLYWYADTIPTRDTSDMPIIANNTTDTNNALDISGGLCWDNTLTQKIILESTIIKKLDANWEAGSNQGGLDSGTKAVNTWYHVFLIAKEDGTSDVLFSTSSTNPTMPENYIYKRRIGSIRTDGNGNIKPFYQDGDYFWWKSKIAELTTTASVSSPQNLTVTVPPYCYMFFEAICVATCDISRNVLYLTSKITGVRTATALTRYGSDDVNQFFIKVDGNSQIQYNTEILNGGTVYLFNMGYIDRRGKN